MRQQLFGPLGFRPFFEVKVGTERSALVKAYDAGRDFLWVTTANGRVEGGIVIDGTHAASRGTHSRWHILSDALHGKGVGRQLITRDVDFRKQRACRKIFLWTFEETRPCQAPSYNIRPYVCPRHI